jgi:L-threonylcarbamoyladenylate synthase
VKDSTKIIKPKKGRIPDEAVRETVRVLKDGGVVVIPTDTVYGLAASPFRPEAIRRIYRLKGRSYKKPLPFLVADFEQARALVEPITPALKSLLDRYWPGPLTVVFKCSPLGRWTAGGKPTIAVRVPRHRAALDLLKKLKAPLAATSANPSGKKPAVTGRQCLRMFRGKVPLVLDAGPCPVGEASTVLDASHEPWTILRHGAVGKNELERFLYGKGRAVAGSR